MIALIETNVGQGLIFGRFHLNQSVSCLALLPYNELWNIKTTV